MTDVKRKLFTSFNDLKLKSEIGTGYCNDELTTVDLSSFLSTTDEPNDMRIIETFSTETQIFFFIKILY